MAKSQPDRHQPLLGPIVQVSLQPATLLVAGDDDARSGLLHLGEPAPHLDSEPGDLDRQPRGLDHAVEQVRAVAERLVMHDGRELQVAPAHGGARAAGEAGLVHDRSRRVDVELLAGQP